MNEINIRTFGALSLTCGSVTVTEKDNRSRMIWRLIKYIIANRPRHIPRDELIDILGTKDNTDTVSSLKTMLHRARAMLKDFETEDGQSLILQKNGCYYWNCDIPQRIDEDLFNLYVSSICRATDPEEHMLIRMNILDLYKGFYMDKSFEDIPKIADRIRKYHVLAIKIYDDVTAVLYEQDMHRMLVNLSKAAIDIDPYQESFHFNLIRSSIALGEHADALRYYKRVTDLFVGKYHVKPSDRIRELYKYILRTQDSPSDDIEEIYSELFTLKAREEALFCEMEAFRVLCSSTLQYLSASSLENVRLMMFSLVARDEAANATHNHHTNSVTRLHRILSSSLSSADVYVKYSFSQYLALVYVPSQEYAEQLVSTIYNAFEDTENYLSYKLVISQTHIKPLSDEGTANDRVSFDESTDSRNGSSPKY